MTEVPPPTRRTRKDASGSAPGAAPSVDGATRAGSDPSSPSAPTPAIPGSAAAAAASYARVPSGAGPGSTGMPAGLGSSGTGTPATPAPGGTGTPAADASGANASPGAPFVDDPERMPTAQLEMAAFGDHLIPYVPPEPPAPRSLAPWALALAILALTASLFTGWLLPLGVTAVVFSALSLRRPRDSRRVGGWALALAVVSLAFSAGWLIWGFSQLAVV